jgi:hypothetical protein
VSRTCNTFARASHGGRGLSQFGPQRCAVLRLDTGALVSSRLSLWHAADNFVGLVSVSRMCLSSVV